MAETTTMPDAPANGRPRLAWKQNEVAVLIRVYPGGGIKAARQALPHRTDTQIRAKLIALEMIALDAGETQYIAGVVKYAQASSQPGLFVRTLVAELRKPIKTEAKKEKT